MGKPGRLKGGKVSTVVEKVYRHRVVSFIPCEHPGMGWMGDGWAWRASSKNAGLGLGGGVVEENMVEKCPKRENKFRGSVKICQWPLTPNRRPEGEKVKKKGPWQFVRLCRAVSGERGGGESRLSRFVGENFYGATRFFLSFFFLLDVATTA